jgi:hypothetical protein
MKSPQKATWVLAIIATLAIPMAKANSGAERFPLGSHCGLIDFADDLLSDHEVQWTDLGRLSSAELQVIAEPDRSSIILTARELTRDASIQTIESAVAALKDIGDYAIMMTVQVEKRLFRVVLHYPGENAVGLVFPLTSSTPVAEIHDSDVVCRKSIIPILSGATEENTAACLRAARVAQLNGEQIRLLCSDPSPFVAECILKNAPSRKGWEIVDACSERP